MRQIYTEQWIKPIESCKHRWTKQSDIIMKSVLDIISQWTVKIEFIHPNDLISQCHVVIFTCDICGEIRKEVTYNPDPFKQNSLTKT
jgi:hypothetical protein